MKFTGVQFVGINLENSFELLSLLLLLGVVVVGVEIEILKYEMKFKCNYKVFDYEEKKGDDMFQSCVSVLCV